MRARVTLRPRVAYEARHDGARPLAGARAPALAGHAVPRARPRLSRRQEGPGDPPKGAHTYRGARVVEVVLEGGGLARGRSVARGEGAARARAVRGRLHRPRLHH